MMHTTEIVEYKKLNNGQFAVRVRCCGDEMQDSWHTMDHAVVLDSENMQLSIAEHCATVARHHAAALQAEATLKTMLGEKKSHS